MVAGQAAEQIIAGVVLSERLAVTMYGAIHRAQFSGQRNLRGLVVDPKLLAEDGFRLTLTDPRGIAAITHLSHTNIVPTMTVETGGPDVVIVTRGVGRYVTVQDLIASAKAKSKQGGRLPLPIAALIGTSVIEALAAAHAAGVVHGAVHPRSVLIDEDGGVRLGDFIAGKALTTALAQGGDSSLWRGLAGFIAPELVVGEDPTPAVDVFAVGAMLFTMLSGEVPPGSLRVTPAVERLVQRALDTDVSRRYRTAKDLHENLLEAMEDDRWELADRAELIREAGLSQPDENIDDATEDLLASLGKSTMVVTARPPSDLPKHDRRSSTAGLDSLIADLGDDNTGLTQVDDVPKRRDPISDIIRHDRKQPAPRVPSLDDPDDDDAAIAPARGRTTDEAAALAAIGDLDGDVARAAPSRAKRISPEPAPAPARTRSPSLPPVAAPAPRATPVPVARPIVDPISDLDVPAPRIKSRVPGMIALVVLIGAGVGFYFVYKNQKAQNAAAEDRKQKQAAEKDALEAKLREELPDPGSIKITSNPTEAGVWLKIGRTPLDSLPLSSAQLHEIRLEGIDGYQPLDTQVLPVHWSGEGEKRRGSLSVPLKAVKHDKAVKLPAMPPKPPDAFGFVAGRGPLHIESTPAGAEVWLYVGMTNNVELGNIQAGQAYELRVLKDGYQPGYATIQPDEWRQTPGDTTPINVAKKKQTLEKAVELVPDPAGSKKGK